MRSLLAIPLILILGLATPGVASADPGDGAALARGAADASVLALVTDDDLFSVTDLSTVLATPLAPTSTTATQHYGPFASSSPDSGTCGNDWAQDTFDRHFTVRANGDGTFTVVEQFKNGSFVTVNGASPGACDGGVLGGLIRDGVTGDLHGYEVITVTGTQTSTSPACVAAGDCTTAGFIASHFAGSFTVGTFFFHYSAGDQTLIAHEWKNASIDRGGNHGDIASSQL